MEVEGPVEYKRCPLCDKDIEASKFRMHEIGCSRQNYKCRECGQCVAKADREEHEEECHAIIQCKYCSFSAPRYKYLDHDETCKSKPKPCPYCEKMIEMFDYEEHVLKCGSKTEKCPTCGDYVRLMDKENHLATNQCQVVLARKQKEEEAEQKKKLEEFQKEREREIAKKKEMDDKRRAEEMERQRKRDERDRQYEQQHGLDDFSEFEDIRDGGIQRPAASQHKQQSRAPPVNNSVRSGAPQINTRQNNARPVQQQPISSYMRPKPGGAAASGIGQRANSRQKMEERKMPGASGASRVTGGNRPVITNTKPKPGANSREPEKLPPMSSVQQRQQRAQQQMPAPMGGGERNFASGGMQQPQRNNASQKYSNLPLPGSRMPNAPSNQPPSRTTNKPDASRRQQQPPKNDEPSGDVLNDYDQMIFNQFLDEDEGERMAQEMQNQMYGGGNAVPGGSSQPMDDGGLGIRKADSGQEMQLIGGMDDSPMRPRQRHVRQQQRQQPDAIMDDDDWGGPALQQQHHGLPNDPMQAMNAAAMHYDQNFGAPVDENEAAIAKAIEESLKNQQHQPPSNYNEEEELQRILEMSKNMH